MVVRAARAAGAVAALNRRAQSLRSHDPGFGRHRIAIQKHPAHDCRMNTGYGAYDAVHPVDESATRPKAGLLARLLLHSQGAGRIRKAADAATTPLLRLLEGRVLRVVASRQIPDQAAKYDRRRVDSQKQLFAGIDHGFDLAVTAVGTQMCWSFACMVPIPRQMASSPVNSAISAAIAATLRMLKSSHSACVNRRSFCSRRA